MLDHIGIPVSDVARSDPDGNNVEVVCRKG
jgi:hypothetical protein